MIRALAVAGGIAGAVTLSQFPEFSQQYLQRLSGAVDELRLVTAAFDLTAQAAGLSREEALAQIGDTAFAQDLRGNIAGNINRYERLAADYQALAGVEPLSRLARFWHFRDVDLAQRTWEDFRPAVPVTADGLIFAGIGFGAGWRVVSLLLGLLARPFRRRRYAA
ncbi:MAG TPA: DUF2937 family protein [Aliiroseovarius sp.]|nr:DUF2937 family protein [Aliiroseovarius sp.]